jgi:hypothetical protein
MKKFHYFVAACCLVIAVLAIARGEWSLVGTSTGAALYALSVAADKTKNNEH